VAQAIGQGVQENVETGMSNGAGATPEALNRVSALPLAIDRLRHWLLRGGKGA
jgi:hypothetical protein